MVSKALEKHYKKIGVPESQYKKVSKKSTPSKTTTVVLPEGDWTPEYKGDKVRFVSGKKSTAWRSVQEWEKASAQELKQPKAQVKTVSKEEDIIKKSFEEKTGKKVTPKWAEGFKPKKKLTFSEKVKQTVTEGIEETKQKPKKSLRDIPTAIGTGILGFGVGTAELLTPFKKGTGVYKETGEELTAGEALAIRKKTLTPVGKGVALGTEFLTAGVSIMPLGSVARPTTKTLEVSVIKGKRATTLAKTKVRYSQQTFFKSTKKTKTIFTEARAVVTKKQAKAVSKSYLIDKPKKVKYGASITKVKARQDIGRVSIIDAKTGIAELKKPSFSFKQPPTTFQPARFNLKKFTEPTGSIIEARAGIVGVKKGKILTRGITGETFGYNVYLQPTKPTTGGTFISGTGTSAVSKTATKPLTKGISEAIAKSTQKIIQTDITRKSLIQTGVTAGFGAVAKTRTRTEVKPLFEVKVTPKTQQKLVTVAKPTQLTKVKPTLTPTITQKPRITPKLTPSITPLITEYPPIQRITTKSPTILRTPPKRPPTYPTSPITPILPTAPIFAIGGVGIGGRLFKGLGYRRPKKKGKKKYRPDIYSILTGIESPYIPKTVTGLEPRPLIVR